uniref:Uncharacterized protein n=1 Tax=Octopus bimaculoides TaxID=37653 RepID=A0A0L8FZB7_OCTBM
MVIKRIMMTMMIIGGGGGGGGGEGGDGGEGGRFTNDFQSVHFCIQLFFTQNVVNCCDSLNHTWTFLRLSFINCKFY